MGAARLAASVLAALLLHPLAAAALTPDLSDQALIPLKLVRAPLAKQIEAATEKTLPLQFAVGAPLSATLADGLWDFSDATTARWRLRVGSPGAESLSFTFARFHLPAGAELWIYDSGGELVQGPYTQANHTPEGKLWSAIVLGDQAVLELRVADAARDEIALELAEVGHGFRGFGKEGAEAKSGSCNIDVVCPQGNPWRNEIRSVARISIDNRVLCTGQMLNNTRQDNDPLFITANHCGIGQNLCGITGTASCSPSSVVFYWNYYNSSCRSSTGTADRNGNGSLAQNQSAASLLAGDVGSDFSLLRLRNAPPPAYNVYFAGWNAAGNVPQSGASIHHPTGDEKSIALFQSPAERADSCIEGTLANCRRNVHAWGLRWAQGTTEQGSSGGGLWDENHLVVGWLSGGEASCSNRSGEDFFARMEAAWMAGAQPGQRLQPWLSPDDASQKSVCGKNQSGGSCDNSSAPEPVAGGSLGWMLLLPFWLVISRRASNAASAA